MSNEGIIILCAVSAISGGVIGFCLGYMKDDPPDYRPRNTRNNTE